MGHQGKNRSSFVRNHLKPAQTNFSQPFFTFWDHFLGTVWTGGDVSARYERAKLAAQKTSDLEVTKSTITNTDSRESLKQDQRPYEDEKRDAELLKLIPSDQIQPKIPVGKAELQATGSREQVLEDFENGGRRILEEETQGEKEARSMIRKSNRRRTASSLTQSDSLRGLRERVSIHGRTGGILGMEHSH